MKKDLLKILLVLLAAFPLWVTIAAFATELSPAEANLQTWKNKINGELLSIKDKKIQILEIISTNDELDPAFLEQDVKLDLSEVRNRGTSRIRLQYFDEIGRLNKLYEIQVKLFLQEQAPVAIRDLRRGQVVRQSDFRLKWVDSSSLPDVPDSLEALIGSEVKSYISADSIIDSSKLQPKTLVRKGETVRVHVLGNGLAVTGIGVAQESGVYGQTIRIMNVDSKKEVFGRVTSAQKVEVRI